MDEYGPEEMAIPEWRLIQKVGGDWAKQLGANPGQFHNKVTDDIADELNLIVADIKIGRAMWGPEISDAGPLCASIEALKNISIYGNDCTECPHKLDVPWSMEGAERRKMCCLNYTILGIDLDHDYLPVILRAHGKSALAARELITQLKMNRALKGELHRAIVNVKSQEKTTPYGTTFALHPKISSLITDEAKAAELKAESCRLLGATLLLPDARPDEDLEPLGFTPEGTPFYSEEEKQKLLASPAAAIATAKKKVEEQAEGEVEKKVKEKSVDLNF